ncbi:MAG: hypothetical protein ACO1OF_16610 [Adhaeribacter sp.]
MKRNYLFFTLLSFMVLNSCTTNNQISQENPAAIPLSSNPNFQVNNVPESGSINNQAQKIFERHIKVLNEKAPENVAVYSQLVDVPGKTTYTAMGNPLATADTTKFKNTGFVTRQLSGLAYLHKRGVDRKGKFISAEYLFKTANGYYYLLGYALVPHLLPNEEDVIIAQDSLDRKSTGLMRTLIKK